MAGFNDYQSGGKGFNSPDKIIENATYREFMQQAGGKDGLASKDQADVVNILNNILDQLVQNTNISNEQTNEIKSALHERVMGTANAPQAAKEGTSLLNSFIKSNTELLKGLSQQKSLTGNERGTLGSISNSSLKQLVMLNQGILNTLKQIAVGVNTSAGIFDKFHADFIEIDASNDKREDKANQEQLGKLDLVRQIIAYGLFSSPTVNKLQQLGTSLMGLGLMKVMGSNAPEPIKKLAAGAIYLQIPQTLMQIIGIVVTQSLSNWLMTSASNLLKNGLKDGLANPAKNMFGNIGANFSKLLPIITNPFVIGGALLVAGIGATVAGVMAHRKKMKENDAKIDADPRLSEDQKEREKLKAHSASGARAGIAGGALTGAGIGAIVGSIIPGVGTAIGAVVGGLIGLIAGPLIGAIVGGWKHFGIIGKDIKAGFSKGLQTVGDKITQGAKWASEHKDQFLSVLKPISKVLLTILEMSLPFFALFKMLYNAASKFFNKNKGDEGPNTIYNPGKSGIIGNALERLNKGSTKYTVDKKGNAYIGGHLITSGYGERIHPSGTGNKMDGKKHFHKGVDIAYKEGDEIGAFMGGQVVYAGNRNDDYGNTVEIKDKNGAIHKYHHGQSIPQAIMDAYKTGKSIEDNTVIMKAGHTGTVTGTHLDYEVWQNGKHTNPLEYLAKDAEEKARAEKAKKEAEEAKWRKEHPVQATVKDTTNLVKQAVSANNNSKSDKTGIKDFVDRQNGTTVNLVNGGMK
jgi:murein DD-endopeptidase MepM/ murein hydrolase activator NlpD